MKVRAPEIGPGEVRAPEIGQPEDRALEICIVEGRAPKVGPVEVRALEARSLAKVGFPQIGESEVGVAKVAAAQVEPAGVVVERRFLADILGQSWRRPLEHEPRFSQRKVAVQHADVAMTHEAVDGPGQKLARDGGNQKRHQQRHCAE
jgi:hypothetical protein